MFADTIRGANTEHEVYFLLTSYIDSVKFSDKQQSVSEKITRLPFNGAADVKERFEQLMFELDAASKRLDDNACTVIREGVHIFGSALNRLRMIEERQCPPPGMPTVAGMDIQAA